MDRTRVSEALNPGSIPGEATYKNTIPPEAGFFVFVILYRVCLSRLWYGICFNRNLWFAVRVSPCARMAFHSI